MSRRRVQEFGQILGKQNITRGRKWLQLLIITKNSAQENTLFADNLHKLQSFPTFMYIGALSFPISIHAQIFTRSLVPLYLRSHLAFPLSHSHSCKASINPLNPKLNPICYLLALLAHSFLHVSRIRVKSLTLRLLMSYIYIYIYIYIWSTYSWCF